MQEENLGLTELWVMSAAVEQGGPKPSLTTPAPVVSYPMSQVQGPPIAV